MANKVEICGVNTSKLPRYKDKEMQEMLMAIKAGDMAVREEFIKGNLRLVLSVIQKFSGRGESPDDLFQVGCVGLIKALDNFDMSHGVKFSTYAVPMIIGEVRRYLRDNNSIRVSRSLKRHRLQSPYCPGRAQPPSAERTHCRRDRKGAGDKA